MNSFSGRTVAIPLSRLIKKSTGEILYKDRKQLCFAFGISSDVTIVVTGTDQDRVIERWWGIGREKQRSAIDALKELQVALITTPNFSLFADTPRWDDLHSIKRIGLVYSEFINAGIPTALHVNGRTPTDFQNWAYFIGERPEITHIAYEFATGAGRAARRSEHVKWLAELGQSVGQPLTLVLRGKQEVLCELNDVFDSTIYLDTSAFIKTMKRQKAEASGNAGITWQKSPTTNCENLDRLLAANVFELEQAIGLLVAPSVRATMVDGE